MITVQTFNNDTFIDGCQIAKHLFEHSVYSTSYDLDIAHALTSVAVFVNRPGYKGWVAYHDNRPVGILWAHLTPMFFSNQLAAYDDVFFVLPKYQNKGAGKALFSEYESWARAHGATAIYTTITSGIDPDQTVAKLGSQGFQPCGVVVKKALED